MTKKSSLFQRRNYFWGEKMMSISFIVFLQFIATIGTISSGLIFVFSQNWNYTEFSYWIIFVNLIIYTFFTAIAVLILSILAKGIFWLFGLVLIYFGEPDKIEIKRVNGGNRVDVQITNGEDQQFEGEMKIMQINGETLPMPLSMGIYRSKDNIERRIVIPRKEPISVIIGLFDSALGGVYIPDVYNQQNILSPSTRIHTKLSGKLFPSGIEIIKENDWSVNYELETGKNLSLAHSLELNGKIEFGMTIRAKVSVLKNKLTKKK